MFCSALRSVFFAAVLAGTLLGCTPGSGHRSEGPQGTLKDYISESFHLKGIGDRSRILGFLTGPAKARLEAWSEEQFLQAFVDTKREFVKLVILEDKKDSANEENITYELTYIDHGRTQGGQGALVTNKKLCRLINDNGKWVIAEMRNIKELVEYRNEMTFPY